MLAIVYHHLQHREAVPRFVCVRTKWSITVGFVLERETLNVRHSAACSDHLGAKTARSSLM